MTFTPLPQSSGSGDLDNIAVTRGEFREEIGLLLEFLAQALGDVTGNYTTQSVEPNSVVLQGTPEIEVGATPVADSQDNRIPSTRWVKEHGRYVGDTAPSYDAPNTVPDGMLWIDNSSSPYSVSVYNAIDAQWDLVSGVPSGTRMLFQQESAPPGWTKVTTGVDNMALRVVTGAPTIVSSAQAFSSVFTSKGTSGTVASTSLSVSQMPVHSHGISDGGHGHGVNDPGHAHGYLRPGFKRSLNDPQATNVCEFEYSASTSASGTGISIAGSGANVSVQNNGGNAGHSHGFSGGAINLAINYVDVIIAEKD